MDEFLSDQRIDRSGECWIWTGSRTKDGYGRVGDHYVHRLAYIEAHGEIPDGWVVMHSCDVPACVNPEHLIAGTQRDNIRDAHNKGRLHPLPSRGTWTMCKKGLHPLSGENLYISPRGERECRACKKERFHRWWKTTGKEKRDGRRVST